jgi:integrase
MARITLQTVKALKPNSQVWDDTLPGFGVRRRANAITYIVKYRAGRGRKAAQRLLTLGRHSEAFPPDAARLRARKVLGQVADSVDPAAARAIERRAGTMAVLAAEFEAAHARIWRPSTVRTNANLIARVIIPAFGQRKPNDVAHTDVARWHVGLGDTPGGANRALAILSSLFGWAIKHGLREAPNPCRDVKRYRGRKIERHLSAAELARLGEALKAVESREPYTVAALRLLIFTGARLGEILGLRWEWVDFETALIRLPDSKTGAKPLFLNAPAREVLAKLPRIEGNPHVIVGAVTGAALVNLEKPWRRIRDAAGIPDVRLHDLRHSFASTGAGMGEGLPIIGKLLGHRHTATTAKYAHLSADPIRAANEKIGARIVAAMTGGEPAPVVPLPVRANP